MMVKQNKTVEILNYDNTYFKVKYNDKIGWIRYTLLNINPSMRKKLRNEANGMEYKQVNNDAKKLSRMLETVVYKVTCKPGGFTVTYTNSVGGTEQKDIHSSKWIKNIRISDTNIFTIIAQAENENATLNVNIYYDGLLLKKASSKGDYVTASTTSKISK